MRFKLFANCIAVNGARRASICDLQRGSCHLIPNDLYEILTRFRERPLSEIKDAYGKAEWPVIDEYFAFLVENELGFWCDDPAAFPDLDLGWETHERVTNAIIDVDAGSHHDFAKILRELDELGCRALQLRFFRSVSPAELDQILAPSASGRLRSIEVLVRYSADWSTQAIEELCGKHPRILSFLVHAAPQSLAMRLVEDTVRVIFRTQAIESEAHCGEVNPSYFAINIQAFTEARQRNSCLNQKISVDRHGEIRNCPAMPATFGNHLDTSLHSVVIRRDFSEIWSVNKDQIEVCKDCEFRYICTDCRALIREPGNRYSKPSKCGYDPYTATWGEAASGK